MKRLFILLLVAAIHSSCSQSDHSRSKKNESLHPNRDKEQSEQQDMDSLNGVEANEKTNFTWNKPEQKKFIQDCKKGSGSESDPAEVKEFCECMLRQAQNFYRTYKEMENKGNDDYDRKIFLNCIDKAPGNEEEDEE